jgi:Uma2 family endonuclease
MRTILTYRDYEAIPADGRRYELHEGELSVAAAPNPTHQRVIGNLNEILRRHVKAEGRGEVLLSPIDCILSDTTVLEPDLVYLDPSGAAQVSARGIEGPPSLVIEVLSPSTARVDRAVKLHLYAKHSVPWYWIVDPDARSLEVYALVDREYQLAERWEGAALVEPPPFAGLRSTLDSIWP